MNVSGSVNVGTDGANFIGSNTGNDNIKVTYFAIGAAQINGILVGGTAILENNIIGSITSMLNTGVTGTGCSFTGINSTGTGLINNNTIGSATTPLSINTAPQTTNNGAQNVYGFFASTGGGVLFTNNTIANINNGSTVASGVTRGIHAAQLWRNTYYHREFHLFIDYFSAGYRYRSLQQVLMA